MVTDGVIAVEHNKPMKYFHVVHNQSFRLEFVNSTLSSNQNLLQKVNQSKVQKFQNLLQEGNQSKPIIEPIKILISNPHPIKSVRQQTGRQSHFQDFSSQNPPMA
mmetsp:Transcript_834/g.1573  ORF Transcript_834/g.1573 Transcript_834/m.1573 type:complete len:105 (-) Transcript_834:1673-1987(-)